MMKALSRERLTKHTRDFIVNAMDHNGNFSRVLSDEAAVLTPGRTGGYPGRERVWRYGLRGAILLCGAGLLLGGCMVSKGKYETAVTDMETAKVELEKSRTWNATLQQENEKLRAENEKSVLDLDLLSAEIQQIKDGQANERDLLDTREAELQRDRAAMMSKLQDIRYVHQELKSQNRALRASVRRYQKALEEVRQANAKRTKPASETAKPNEIAPEPPPVAARQPAPKPVPPPVAVPFNGTATPVNINTASANDLELFLGLTKEVADKVVSNRPYRLRGELISKQVLPQATFDVIKDRITAAPPQ